MYNPIFFWILKPDFFRFQNFKQKSTPFFEVFLTVHLGIILATDQLNAPVLVL